MFTHDLYVPLASLYITEIKDDIGRRSETIKRWNIDVSEKAQQEESISNQWQLASTTLPSGMLNAEKGIQQSVAEKGIEKKEDEDEAKKKEAEKGIQQSTPAAAAAAVAGNHPVELDMNGLSIPAAVALGLNVDSNYKKMRDGPLKKCGKCGIE